MKIPSLLLYLFSLPLMTGCNSFDHVVEMDPQTGITSDFYRDKKTELIQGILKKSDASGKLIEVANYKDGKLNGLRELYYPDGTLKVRERYHNDTLKGLYEYFHPNGQVELSGYYINGEMYGLWRKYYPTGTLEEEVLMVGNEENGPFIEYYDSGIKEAEGFYLNGPNENGKLHLYDSTGVLVQTMWCKMGRCETTWKKG